MRILLADDSPVVRECIGNALRDWGYDTTVVNDGEQALARLRADSGLELAILDWQMPGLDGPEVCRRLREGEDSRYIYTIVLTAATDGQSITEAMNQGADDYLLKNAPRTELHARLKAARRIVELQQKLRSEAKRLAHAQRMESVGNLAAGMAHELNTPIQYISHNLEFITQEMSKVLEALKASGVTLSGVDVPFLLAELIPSCRETREGIEKVKSILNALRDFSVHSSEERSIVSLNELVETAITLCRNEWNDKADLVLKLSDQAPRIRCIPQDVSQVALQLTMNAAQAIERRYHNEGEKGLIEVSTEVAGSSVRIKVHDTGCGIPVDIRDKIFDPFFTTKAVGSGIGAGLSLIHSAVVERHQGTIEFESEVDVGTTFVVTMPMCLEPDS